MSIPEEPKKSFSLKSQETDFKAKSASIFDGLGDLEAKHNAVVNARKRFSRQSEETLMKDDPEAFEPLPKQCATGSGGGGAVQSRVTSSHEVGSRGGGGGGPPFSRPRGRAPRPRRTPDFKVHPKNWTMYDLGDVPKQDMSDRANTGAALDFLRNQRAEKYGRELSKCVVEEDMMETDDKIVFNKPSAGVSDDCTHSSDGVKPHVAEYVVGQKRERLEKKKTGPIASGEEVDLGHLDDEETEQKERKTEPCDGAQDSVASPSVTESETTSNVETVTFKKTKHSKRNMRKRCEEDEDG